MTTTTVARPLNGRQEAFCVYYFRDKNATQAAIKAGYSPLYAGQNADKLLKNTNIAKRIAECEAKVESEAVGTVTERKKRLTEIYRANLTDFIDETGNIILKPSAALAELVVEEWRGNGEDAPESRIKRLKLRDPVAAIDSHNRMERIGTPETVNNFHGDIKILVVYEERKREIT